MKKRMFSLALGAAVVACGGVALALATDFTWDDGGQDHAWDNGDNWDSCPYEPCPFPDDGNDNATIPYNSGNGWTVELKDYDIGDLAIEGDVDFTGSVELTTESMVIDAADGDIVITMDGSGQESILVNQ